MSSSNRLLSSYISNGPHTQNQEKLALFGKFVGEWDIDIEFFNDLGESTFQGIGAWEFAWVLDGRVLQDVLTYPDLNYPNSFLPDERNIGTSLRLYDPKSDAWQVIWLGASSGNICFLKSTQIDDDLVLERKEEGSAYLQWRFSEVTDDSFTWTGHYSNDKGNTWLLEQKMLARRRN